ncbi:MAG TPA: hypothetical protein ENN63_07520 [Bacteroidetes bacterium]|nr:hypothetical protein [Bacteroidota bacterium]
MKGLEHIYFESRKSFRDWLEKNHDKKKGIWMVFFKKHTRVKCIEYREALEEALCYGWSDSIIKKVDDDRYVRKFTPRTNTSHWSELNKKIVLSLIEQGKMTEAGLKKIDSYLKTGKVAWKYETSKEISQKKELQVPDFISGALAENEPAWAHFRNLAPSYKKQYVLWIAGAKREETRLTRLEQSIALLKENKRLGMK